MNENTKQIVVMSATSVAGGVIGGVAGLFVLGPHILIPIGVVIGIAVGLSLSKRSRQA
ncbi:hypothetical protein ACWGSK_27325 [Nocardiopsis sp. NPDC055551]|uniref:hypothetical protein n=1 Tax=Nocardiopsis sp. NPDC006832 TaxID=3157188 RepID=UPI0033F9F5F4